MKNKWIYIGILFNMYACGPKITTHVTSPREPLDYKQKIYVLDMEAPVPENSAYLGTTKAGDTGFTTQNDYNTVVEKLKEEARKAGANIIKITKYKQPNLWSTAQHIQAQLYHSDVPPVIEEEKQANMDWDYALLHFYRLSGPGAAVGYNIYLGDSIICRTKNKWKEHVKVYKTGYYTIWAKTESKTELPIKIEKGKEYYIRCGMGMGFFVGHPTLNMVDNLTGKAESQKLKERTK